MFGSFHLLADKTNNELPLTKTIFQGHTKMALSLKIEELSKPGLILFRQMNIFLKPFNLTVIKYNGPFYSYGWKRG